MNNSDIYDMYKDFYLSKKKNAKKSYFKAYSWPMG